MSGELHVVEFSATARGKVSLIFSLLSVVKTSECLQFILVGWHYFHASRV